MTHLSRAYTDEFGEPVVVLVVEGERDVSRLHNLLAGAPITVEQLQVGAKILDQSRRNVGGRAALRLLAEHGGRNLLVEAGPVRERIRKAVERLRELASLLQTADAQPWIADRVGDALQILDPDEPADVVQVAPGAAATRLDVIVGRLRLSGVGSLPDLIKQLDALARDIYPGRPR